MTDIRAPGENRKDGLGPKAMAAQVVLELLNGRCGNTERAHDPPGNGLAGGTMPSGRFGANAASEFLNWLRAAAHIGAPEGTVSAPFWGSS